MNINPSSQQTDQQQTSLPPLSFLSYKPPSSQPKPTQSPKTFTQFDYHQTLVKKIPEKYAKNGFQN